MTGECLDKLCFVAVKGNIHFSHHQGTVDISRLYSCYVFPLNLSKQNAFLLHKCPFVVKKLPHSQIFFYI